MQRSIDLKEIRGIFRNHNCVSMTGLQSILSAKFLNKAAILCDRKALCRLFLQVLIREKIWGIWKKVGGELEKSGKTLEKNIIMTAEISTP